MPKHIQADTLVCNVTQSMKRKSLMTIVPTILTHSSELVLLKSPFPRMGQRPMTPTEKLAVMGHRCYEPEESLIAQCLDGLSVAEKCSLAGNGWVASKIGAGIFWFLAFVYDLEHSASSSSS